MTGSWPFSRPGMRFERRCHSVWAPCRETRAASCTCTPAGRSGATAGGVRAAGGPAAACAAAAGGAAATGGAEAGMPVACAAGGAWVEASSRFAAWICACNAWICGVSGAGARLSWPSPDLLDITSSFAPTTCMPPGLTGFTRIGRVSASMSGTPAWRWPAAIQPPATSTKARPSPPAMSASRRVAGSTPLEWRKVR